MQLDEYRFVKLAVALTAIWNLVLFWFSGVSTVRDRVNSYGQQIATGTSSLTMLAQPLLLATILGIVFPSFTFWLVAKLGCNWEISAIESSIFVFTAKMFAICLLVISVRDGISRNYLAFVYLLLVGVTVAEPFLWGMLLSTHEPLGASIPGVNLSISDEMRDLVPNLRFAYFNRGVSPLGAIVVDWSLPVLLIDRDIIALHPNIDLTAGLWHEIAHLVYSDGTVALWLDTVVSMAVMTAAGLRLTKQGINFVERMRKVYFTTFVALIGILIISLHRYTIELRADAFAASHIGFDTARANLLQSVDGMSTHFVGALLYPSVSVRLQSFH